MAPLSSEKVSKNKYKCGKIYGKHFCKASPKPNYQNDILNIGIYILLSSKNIRSILTQKKDKRKNFYQGPHKLRKARGNIKQNCCFMTLRNWGKDSSMNYYLLLSSGKILSHQEKKNDSYPELSEEYVTELH